MPIDIWIDTDLREETFVVWDFLEAQTFILHVGGEPLGLEFDPETWIIRGVEFMGVADG